MPDSTPAPAGNRHHRRARGLAEVAALFTATAAADFVADLVNHGPDGTVLLVTSSLGLLAAAGFHTWWSRRHSHAPPAPTPAPAPAGPEPSDPRTALWRMRTTVQDAPGSLGTLCTALAGSQVDIVTLQTHPLAAGTVDEFLLRAPATLPAAALALTVTAAGGTDTWLERADAHDLVDAPARILALATRTALNPAELPLALRELFGRCTITATPEDHPAPAADTPEPGVMLLRDPAGGTITVRRDHLPFTPTEFARARALVELGARLGAHRPAGRNPRPLPEDGGLTLRPAGPKDVPAALAMHGRCSSTALGARYHGPVGDADRYLAHLLSPRFGRSLAVEAADGRLVALGHLLWDGDENDESEIALLVEDGWQRRGVGSALLCALVELAAAAGREAVYAVTRSTNTAMVATMRGLGLPLDYRAEDGTVVITAALPPTPAGSSTATLPWVTGRA